MPGETMPLITTVPVGPPVRRYPHQTLRRFCTIASGSSLIALLIVFLVTIVFDPAAPDQGDDGHHHHHHGRPPEFPFEELQRILLDTPSSKRMEQWSRYYASGPHLAGKNISQAEWTRDRWEEWGIKSDIVAYDVYLDYPVGHRLALLNKGRSKSKDSTSSWDVAYEATLEEDVLEEDPTTTLEDRVPTFHGYSGSGNVTASFVYVNYGSYQDFEDLSKANVTLEGRIAIARYGGIHRGLKVKRAQQLGMSGVVLYSDPGDDGGVTEANGYDTYPNGPARNPSSVQRGSVGFLSEGGDPTTPGYPSKPGVPRHSVEGSIPSIPSIPISYVDALPILKALNGHGPSATDINEHWARNTGLGYKGIEYNVGPSPDDVVLNLHNEQEYTTTPIWNVVGIINGSIPDEVVIVGNHRDSWIAGGAADPNGGSAILDEVVRSFGVALEKDWKPLRTIVFASWDGEEYNLLGSSEWVEEYLPWLSEASVAYVNIDIGVSNPALFVAASPLLHKVFTDVTALVQSPNQTVEGQTVRDVWDGEISTIGSGSDFTAFQDHAGIPSLHFGFHGESERSPVYMDHSNYDSFHWMSKYGDPGFVYHKTMAQLLGLTLAKLSDVPLIALNATDYAVALSGYVKSLENKLASLNKEPSTAREISETRARPVVTEVKGDVVEFKASLTQLYKSIDQLYSAAVKLDAKAERLTKEARGNMPWWKLFKKLQLWHSIRATNSKYKSIERAFVYPGGLDGRSWYKHVVFAPELWTGYGGAVFPGLVESIDNKDYVNAQKWVIIIDNCIKTATKTVS